MSYKGPFPMSPITGEQLKSVADYLATVDMQCAPGWNLSQLAMAYRLRGRVVVWQYNRLTQENLDL